MWMILFVACPGTTDSTAGDDDSATFEDEFCASASEDGGRYEVQEDASTSSSGLIEFRILTTESEDARDPVYVAFKDYTLRDVDAQGVPITGQTSGDGLVNEQVGAGTWSFVAAFARGSTTCTAELEFPVQADNTTVGCPVMTCPR